MVLMGDMGDLLSGSNVMLFGLILVIAVLMLRAQRHLGRRQQTVVRPSQRTSDPRPTPRPSVVDSPAQTQQWQVEMHELARELSGRLDSKISALQSLIIAADQRIERLGSIVPAAQREDSVEPTHPASEPPAAMSGRQVRTQADALAAARSSDVYHASTSRPSSASGRNRQEIYALADSGATPAVIAAQMGAPIGEVELVLGLRPRQ